MSFFSKIRNWFMKRFETTRIEREFNVRIASPMDMEELIESWLKAYQGTPDWVGEAKEQVLHTLNVASTMCRDLANKSVSEIEISDNARENELFKQFVDDELTQQIRDQLEFGLASGAFICRPYYDPEMNLVSLSWYTADRFIPVDFSGKRCVSGIFIDQDIVNDNGSTTVWTKLELQKWNYGKEGVGGSVDITVKLYKSNSAEMLGSEVELSSYPKWAGITPSAHIDNLQSPLFVYAPMPFTNNKALNQKFGVSLYKDGMSQLEQIDRNWDDLNWELQSSQNKVFVDEQMLETVRTSNGEIVPRLDSKERRLYAVMDAQGAVGKYMDIYSPTIRQADITATLKTNLSLLCTACGLDSGAYVYDEQAQAVTATEIRTKNQKTYQTICALQKWTVSPAIQAIVTAVREMQELYEVPSFGDVDLNIAFGDSILIDVETDKQNAQRETTLGLRSKLNYIMEYRGLSEEDARKELAVISSEQPEQVDFFGGNEN